MMKKTEKVQKHYDVFVGNLLFTWKQFCLAKWLAENWTQPTFRRNVMFWNIVRISITRGYLLGLAKVFDGPSKRFEDVLSIHFLLDVEFAEYENTISQIIKLRNKVLSHDDATVAIKMDDFMKSLELKPKEVEALFRHLIVVTGEVARKYGLSGNTSRLFEDAERDINGDTENIINRLVAGTNYEQGRFPARKKRGALTKAKI